MTDQCRWTEILNNYHHCYVSRGILKTLTSSLRRCLDNWRRHLISSRHSMSVLCQPQPLLSSQDTHFTPESRYHPYPYISLPSLLRVVVTVSRVAIRDKTTQRDGARQLCECGSRECSQRCWRCRQTLRHSHHYISICWIRHPSVRSQPWECSATSSVIRATRHNAGSFILPPVSRFYPTSSLRALLWLMPK